MQLSSGNLGQTGSADTRGGAVQIQGMSEEDLARTWSLYVKELAVLLWAVDGREAPPEVLARIQHLAQRELLFLYFQRVPCSAPSVHIAWDEQSTSVPGVFGTSDQLMCTLTLCLPVGVW